MQSQPSPIPTTLGLRHEDESKLVTLDYSGPETYGMMCSVKTPVEASPELLQLYAESLKDDRAAALWTAHQPARVLHSSLTAWLTDKIGEHAPGYYEPIRRALWKHQERAGEALRIGTKVAPN